MKPDLIYVYGKHAVAEAIRKRPEAVQAVHVRVDLADDPTLQTVLGKAPVVHTFSSSKLPGGIDRDANHQGVIAEISSSALLRDYKAFKADIEVTPDTCVVVLGEVQDPHNVGAIIRSAAALGASAVLLPEFRGCPVTGTVIKVSAGTAFSIPLVQVKNINNALLDLKELGFWVYGLDGDGDIALPDETFSKPSVFVVGNEASGIRLKTHEKCDTILSIPMSERAESLNASVSAAITLYAWSAQHPVTR